MKKNISGFLIFILLAGIASGGYFFATHYHGDHKSEKEQKQLYTCPMHPQIVQDKPGDCPICGMKLVPMKKGDEKKADKKSEKKKMYKSTMNPNEISDKPGKDSMGMEMVPFEIKEKDTSEDEAGTVQGLAPVSISKEKREMMGLAFETVKYKHLSKEIRTSTKIIQDETRQHKVTSKISGYVEKLYINHTGQYVKKGSPLLSVYSQELLAAQQEYLSALKVKQRLGTGSEGSLSGNIDDIIESSRERLRLLDISNAQIEQIKSTGAVTRTVTLHSPASGYVTEKMVLEGQKIMMNDALMVIVDLSVVWGEADIYESDLQYIKKGMPVEVTLPYWPGKVFRGKVFFLNPFLSPETRTMKAHIEIPNSGLVLKPNMFGDAKLLYPVGKRISIPESAVMRTGVRDYVFIEGKNDMIVPYEVKLGVRSSDGYYEVISGLKAGEKVVTSANFLVDSESSLKSAFKSASGEHKH